MITTNEIFMMSPDEFNEIFETMDLKNLKHYKYKLNNALEIIDVNQQQLLKKLEQNEEDIKSQLRYNQNVDFETQCKDRLNKIEKKIERLEQNEWEQLTNIEDEIFEAMDKKNLKQYKYELKKASVIIHLNQQELSEKIKHNQTDFTSKRRYNHNFMFATQFERILRQIETKIEFIEQDEWDQLTETEKEDLEIFEEKLKSLPIGIITDIEFEEVKNEQTRLHVLLKFYDMLKKEPRRSVEEIQSISRDQKHARRDCFSPTFKLRAIENRLLNHRAEQLGSISTHLASEADKLKQALRHSLNQEKLSALQNHYESTLYEYQNQYQETDNAIKSIEHQWNLGIKNTQLTSDHELAIDKINIIIDHLMQLNIILMDIDLEFKALRILDSHVKKINAGEIPEEYAMISTNPIETFDNQRPQNDSIVNPNEPSLSSLRYEANLSQTLFSPITDRSDSCNSATNHNQASYKSPS